jgi:hypothetical protein
MHTRHSSGRRCRMSPHTLKCLAVSVSFLLLSLGVHVHGNQQVTRITLSVEDSRPIAKAIDLLATRHAWVITYEDPRFMHDSDIDDVTESVRRDLDKYRPGEAPKVLVPRGGALEIAYDVTADTNEPTDRRVVLNELLNVQNARDKGGKFRLEMNGDYAHVIPIAVKDVRGEWVKQESMLDAMISISTEERTGLEKLKGICKAISEATKSRVTIGNFPTNLFLQYRDREGAERERARDVLAKQLERVSSGGRNLAWQANLSWRLLYDPGKKAYALNIYDVPLKQPR